MLFIIFDKVNFFRVRVCEYADEMFSCYHNLPEDIRKNCWMIGIPIDVYYSLTRTELLYLIKELMSST